MALDTRERLIVALDVPSVREAESLVATLGDSVSFYKVGYQLAAAGYDMGVAELAAARAIKAGADYLVMGRPIMAAIDPKASAEQIVSEIEQAAVK